MPSRVIHIRVDDWVLLGCHDILKAGGKSTENLPLSTVTRDVLPAFVRKMQQNEIIPFYSRDQIIDRMEELYAGELDIDIPFDAEELFEFEEEPALSDTAQIAQRAADIIAAAGEPAISAETQTEIRDTMPKQEVKSINIFSQESKTPEEIQRLAPKDRFVEQFLELGDPVFTKAVCICYSNLDNDLWGSEIAEGIIVDLVNAHNAK